MEVRLEKWRSSSKDAGLKVSRTKTEHLPPLTSLEKIKMRQYERSHHTDLSTTTAFKYSRTTINQEGGYGKEISVRIEKAWNRGRELSGVLCDKKI